MNKYILIIVGILLLTLALLGCSNSTNIKENISAVQNQESNNKKVDTAVDQVVKEEMKPEVETEVEIKVDAEAEVVEAPNTKPETEVETGSDDKETLETSVIAPKTESMVIVLDPGHGGTLSKDKEPNAPGSKTMKYRNVSGATGISTKTPEPVINLAVALKLKKHLIQAGYKVIMTRTTADKTISNIERAEIGNINNATLVLRIHADGSSNTNVKGASMLVPGNVGYAKDVSDISRKYGECILDTLINEVGMPNRGIRERKDITGFNWSKVPVVLVEMGYQTNPEEDKLLASDSYQEKIALALFNGIDKALN